MRPGQARGGANLWTVVRPRGPAFQYCVPDEWLLTFASADGVSTPRQRSSSRVRFDLGSNTAHSPDASRRKDDAKRGDSETDRHSDTETSDDRKHRRRKRKGKERERGGQQASRDRSPSQDSDGTIELPARFDEQGNRRHEDPLAQKINDLINGQGGAGGLFKALLGGNDASGGGGGDDEGKSSRRRSRR